MLAAYGKENATREDVTRRFRVSLGMVKKLIQQRRQAGSVQSRWRLCGRKRCSQFISIIRDASLICALVCPASG